MAEKRNPYLPPPDVVEEEIEEKSADDDLPPVTGPSDPQPNTVNSPDAEWLLPAVNYSGSASLWIVGTHGGSGESTLANLNPEWKASQHCWPVGSGSTQRKVVLVARTNLYGLTSMQKVCEQWASGNAEVEVLGMVLMADSPGQPPKTMRELIKVLSGAVPRTWVLPWVEAWRVEEPSENNTPRAMRKLVKDLSVITGETNNP